jgi:predicted acyltransferase
LLHAEWNGFTPADIVFPSFLMAVCNALCFVMQKLIAMTQARVMAKKLYDHIFNFTGMYAGSLFFAIWFMQMCWLAG